MTAKDLLGTIVILIFTFLSLQVFGDWKVSGYVLLTLSLVWALADGLD